MKLSRRAKAKTRAAPGRFKTANSHWPSNSPRLMSLKGFGEGFDKLP